MALPDPAGRQVRCLPLRRPLRAPGVGAAASPARSAPSPGAAPPPAPLPPPAPMAPPGRRAESITSSPLTSAPYHPPQKKQQPLNHRVIISRIKCSPFPTISAIFRTRAFWIIIRHRCVPCRDRRSDMPRDGFGCRPGSEPTTAPRQNQHRFRRQGVT